MDRQRILLRLINFWPPMLGAGIRVKVLTPDLRAVDVEMKLRSWNANYVGTHYGGSLYSMADPFYMVMLMNNLGRGYIVWDKAATIRFRKAGRGKVKAQFRLTEERIREIAEAAHRQPKYDPVFTVEIKDEAGEVVAEVEKVLYVRKKEAAAASGGR